MIVYDDISDNKIAIYDKNIERLEVMHEKMDYDQSNFEINYRYGDIVYPHIKYTEPLKNELNHFFASAVRRALAFKFSTVLKQYWSKGSCASIIF